MLARAASSKPLNSRVSMAYPVGVGVHAYGNLFVYTTRTQQLYSAGFCLYNFHMAKRPKKPTGRPRKQPGEARDSILQIRLTPGERALLDEAAGIKALDMSAWVRSEMLA